MKSNSVLRDIPLGLGMALMARDPEAVQRFARLPDEQKEAIIHLASRVESKKEMRQLVFNLLEHDFNVDAIA